ncbi:CDP-glycerol--glycerophosphate glycerophosphotransferase [Nocardioides sp. GY 10113]|uniref:CDP-glycerol glycerophosphotransferase family protein n=1 Tax=Nocardioides sp. GY 10113 TaxID=2569761 RepID=UPI0010A937FF|nr:CDP-glycerol glycerophosphotransferase family protein [Nocardioides sp. GY 10113]TIC82248.1 CDP-glycerol--glycerophosphate glycerophosphotransferase [Nocardioides sp. GY 10113]
MEHADVIAYFGDDPSRTYQLIQWLPVLELLDREHPVGLMLRNHDSAEILRQRTHLAIEVHPEFAALTERYHELDAKVVLYCNNSMINFQSLLDARKLHVHINHGESDKQSMASNNAKAYDRVFVAGEAAVQRLEAGLLAFDTTKLVRIGRPQLDLSPAPVLSPTERRTVLYAPTWEGDAEYNDYSSVDTIGPEIAEAIVAVPDVRIVYKPHPKIAVSKNPAIREGHRRILEVIGDAAQAEPGAGHVAVVSGDILAVMPDCDAMVTDVSSVGLDWLYLKTDRPIFVTDRHQDPERLRQEVPVSRCADVIEAHPGIERLDVEGLTALLASRLEHDEHHLARVAMRHHYFDDNQIGDSTRRFIAEVADLVALRDGLLGEATSHGVAMLA